MRVKTKLQNKWIKWTSMLCLWSCLTWAFPTQSFASELCFTNTTSVQKIVKFIKSGALDAKDVSLCNRQLAIVSEQKAVMVEERAGLLADKSSLEISMGEYKDKYTQTAEDLTKCRTEQPSRITWFGAGFGTALLLVILGAFALK